MTGAAAPVGAGPGASVWRLGARATTNKTLPFAVGTVLFVIFFCFPVATGLVVNAAFRALESGETTTTLLFAAALVGVEALRIVSIYFGAIWFITAWEAIQSLMRANMLFAQVVSGGPLAGPPVGSAGEAVSRFRDDPEDVAEFVDSWIDVTGGVVFSVIALSVLGSVDARAALVLAIPMAAVALLNKALDDRVKRYRSQDRAATVAYVGRLDDVLGAAMTIRLNAATPHAIAELRRLAERRRRSGVRDRVLEQALLTMSGGFAGVALGIVLVVSASAIRSGALGASELALFVVLVAYLEFLPRMVGKMLARAKQSTVAFENMRTLVAEHEPERIVDHRRLPVGGLGVLDSGPTGFEVAPPERRPLETLELRDWTVRFGDGSPVLDGLDLTIRAGTVTVVTGTVGAGKTTLLRSLLGLTHHAGVAGSIRWNGESIEDRAAWFAPPHASFLPQVPHLVSASLAENVALGRTEIDLARALSLAAVERDVALMSDGADTLVGPRGMRLSGGQRQRIGAARALASGAELVVLDDLSSALDTETERRLWDGLTAAGMTVLAVSHRPLAFELADHVLELRDGRLVERSA